MMTVDQAREIVERQVMASNTDRRIVEGATLEFPGCFVFIYQTKKFVETGEFGDMFVGHGPVLVSRQDGKVFETGSAFSIAHYVGAFEACGDPLGKPTDKVKIIGWNQGADKIRATTLVKAKSEMGLSQAKDVIDNALANRDATFTTGTIENAEDAVAKLREYGFDSRQLWSNQC